MPPLSSLVFVVIVAVWAVYLVQHWIRRRDHLATARSVDRFSEAMRVLERRRSLAVPEAEDRPRSYAASPLRPARPGPPEVVVVKHGRSAPAATAVGPTRDYRRALGAARVRAAVLAAGWLALVVLVGLGIARVLPPWSALVGVALCALSVAYVRWSVARTRRARRAAAARRAAPSARPAARTRPTGRSATGRPAAARRPARPVAAPVEEPVRPGHEFAAQSVAITLRGSSRRELVREDAVVEEAPAARSSPPGPELYDVQQVEAALSATPVHAGATAPEAAPDDRAAGPADGTWDPVPVPPPTYTLKARAPRPSPTGSSSLPADGTEMALDEEFEELPRIDRVG
ncbi:hypothetical protein GCM10009584_15660 [Ornithinimicrobium humiphilum]|uniref:Uncharacterized protein n=1 Tax=Ornithinimicrobium humiphilum TaxID=125288 RepID=A0A543KKQ5_9MICO|nr:hypothetical protein [Ornithinimicrobium humiphilum]TQM95659.1 hypothetical protein FB476_0506 [Ornithinimicrobium humiphilum]